MKPRLLIAGTLMTWAALSNSGRAEQLHYWGARPDGSVGWIELGDKQYFEVTEGADIPGWGRVTEIREDRLIVEQLVSEAEKARLRESGALVHDLLVIHIPREDLRRPGGQRGLKH